MRNVALPLDRECRSTTTINRDTKISNGETREMRERTSEGKKENEERKKKKEIEHESGGGKASGNQRRGGKGGRRATGKP